MMQAVDLIISPRWLLPIEPQGVVLENHSIAIKNGIIVAIEATDIIKTDFIAKESLALPQHVLMPGFVNSHTHAAMNLLRGICDDIPLMTWLHNYIWPAEKKWLSDAFVHDGTQLAIAEMIKSGTTCFNDMYFFIPAAAKAVEQAGIRAALGITVFDVPTANGDNAQEYLNRGLPLFEQFANHPLIQLTMAPHAIYTTSDETLIEVRKAAEHYHAYINMHVQETQDEVAQSLAITGKRPLERLHALGLLSEKFIAIHMTQVTPEEIELAAKTHISVVHCPESNMKLASGTCPAQALLNAGVNVALGTDGAASNNDLDMISEMRSAALSSKLSEKNPTTISAVTALTMATLHGAKALGKDKVFGSLLAGKAADMIAIDLNHVNTVPIYHPTSAVVYAANRQQVSDVWVAGKRLLKDYRLTTIDEASVLNNVAEWTTRISAI
ncbi:MAG: TRZ/ATZ family hydrolase [Gammaproteobacteria bacterium]